MNRLEELEEEAFQQNVMIIDYPFQSNRIKGLYCDGNIALNKELSPVEKSCVLAEELAHHMINCGDIIDQKDVANRKQETKARMIAYNKMIGLSGIISAYKAGCKNTFEIAEYLDVSEEFLIDAFSAYRSKYGEYTTSDNYIIYFEPHFGILESISLNTD